MDIILIPCCKRKIVGGDWKFQSSRLSDVLKPATYSHLMEARMSLASQLALVTGPDLGFQKSEGKFEYLPAYHRYSGVIYQVGNVRNLYKSFSGKLIILSALYGLLEACDTIQNYDLAMTDTLPRGIRVSTFWRQFGLNEILEEYYLSSGPSILNDLLSNNYRKALEPWPSSRIAEYNPYNYPGLRTASNYPRGQDLKHLLSI